MNIVKLKVVATLEQTAASINRQFEIAEKEYEKGRGARAKERYARVTAGLQLLDARQRVELGRETNMGWEEWCEHNIDRSQSDIRAVMALAVKVREKGVINLNVRAHIHAPDYSRGGAKRSRYA